jgi:Na+/proline symporter
VINTVDFLGGAPGETEWTTVMILTYMFALMGVQSSPAFIMYFFSMKSPRVLVWQQLLFSAFIMGIALIFFAPIIGMGAKALQLAGNPPFLDIGQATVVPTLMKQLLPPVLLGFVFIGHIAAIHSTASTYVVTGSSMLVRDINWKKSSKQIAGDNNQIWKIRLVISGFLAIALGIGMTSKAALVIIGALATSFGLLMYIPLLGVIWGVRFSAKALVLGILVGMPTVYFTYQILTYPLSIHCAFWGLAAGFIVAWLTSKISQDENNNISARQEEIRKWLDEVDTPSEKARKWRVHLKWLVPTWFFFAIGPGCILGNTAFSFYGFTPLWSWQIFWWLVGFIMMYLLCIKAEMSTWAGDPDEIVTIRE